MKSAATRIWTQVGSRFRPTCSLQCANALRNYVSLAESPSDGVTKLSGRGVIRLAGRDTLTFLQGLVTNDVRLLEPNSPDPPTQSMYAAFLNAQGRFMYDVFFHPRHTSLTEDGIVLLADVDEVCASELLHHLKKFRLRAKVDISHVSDEYQVWSRWGPECQEPGDAEIQAGWVKDPRLQALGLRSIFHSDNTPTVEPNAHDSPRVDEDCEYFRYRIDLGVAEGSSEMVSGEALPLEFNLAALNAINFKKGCYVGQELTARTHFRGRVRKRVMPVRCAASGSAESPFAVSGAVPGKTVVDDQGKKVGRLCALTQDNHHGLALLRLKQACTEGAQLFVDNGGEMVKPLRPTWWPQEWGHEEE